MITRYFRKLLIPLAALAMILACSGPFAAATPQPAATLNSLYTAAAQTLESMSTQGAYYTFTPPPPRPQLCPSSFPHRRRHPMRREHTRPFRHFLRPGYPL